MLELFDRTPIEFLSFFIIHLRFSHRWWLASMVERRNWLEAALLVSTVLGWVRLRSLAPLQTDWTHLRTISWVLRTDMEQIDLHLLRSSSCIDDIESHLLLFRCILNMLDWRLGTLAGASVAAVLFGCGALPKLDGVGAVPYDIGTLPIALLGGSDDAVSAGWRDEGFGTGGTALANWFGANPGIFGGGLNAAVSSLSSCSVLIHFFFSGSHTICTVTVNIILLIWIPGPSAFGLTYAWIFIVRQNHLIFWLQWEFIEQSADPAASVKAIYNK